jgi:hypothetical protein
LANDNVLIRSKAQPGRTHSAALNVTNMLRTILDKKLAGVVALDRSGKTVGAGIRLRPTA